MQDTCNADIAATSERDTDLGKTELHEKCKANLLLYPHFLAIAITFTICRWQAFGVWYQMAGNRHHHVWQMLQRGFSWEEYNDHHVWVYRKGSAPEQTVTRKFGQLKNFYRSVGSDADDNITNFENTIQGFIHESRKMADGQKVDSDTAAVLVSHLEMRSLFLRNEMSRLGERMVRFLFDCMSSPKKYQAIMSAYIRNHPELVEAELEKAGIPVSMRPLFRDLFAQAAPKLIRDSAPEMKKFLNQFNETIANTMDEAAKNSQNKALLSNFSEIKRADLHRSLNFSIFRPKDANFILPDTHQAFFTQKGCAPFSQKDSKVEGVIVPLSPEVAIFGRRDPLFERDMPTIQRALASCSYEAFFVPSPNQ